MPTQENTTSRRLLRDYGEALAGYTELQADVTFFAAKVQDLEEPRLRRLAATVAAQWLHTKYDRTWAKRPAHDASAITVSLCEAIECANWDAFVSNLEDWTALYATNQVMIAGVGPDLLDEDRDILMALAYTACEVAARKMLAHRTPPATEEQIAPLVEEIIDLMVGQKQGTRPRNSTPAYDVTAAVYESFFRLHSPVLLCLGAYTTKQDLKDAIDREWEATIWPHLQTAPPAAHRTVDYKRHVALYEYYLAFWETRPRPAEDKKAEKKFIDAVLHDKGFWARVWSTVPSSDQVRTMLHGALEWLPCDRGGGASCEGFWTDTMQSLLTDDVPIIDPFGDQLWWFFDAELTNQVRLDRDRAVVLQREKGCGTKGAGTQRECARVLEVSDQGPEVAAALVATLLSERAGQVATLSARVTALESENAGLRARLETTSHNSSTPPSSDGPATSA